MRVLLHMEKLDSPQERKWMIVIRSMSLQDICARPEATMFSSEMLIAGPSLTN